MLLEISPLRHGGGPAVDKRWTTVAYLQIARWDQPASHCTPAPTLCQATTRLGAAWEAIQRRDLAVAHIGAVARREVQSTTRLAVRPRLPDLKQSVGPARTIHWPSEGHRRRHPTPAIRLSKGVSSRATGGHRPDVGGVAGRPGRNAHFANGDKKELTLP
jgi:hypothetical protein